MKAYKFLMTAAAILALAACSDMDNQDDNGFYVTADQLAESNNISSSRGEATFTGMYTMMADPYFVFGSSYRADDFGFVMMAISQDCEGPDLHFPNSGYNWFAPCGEMTSRTPSYANPYIRYAMPYNQIAVANDIITTYSNGGDETTEAKQKIAQARALRAFDY
ncbi:MAG: carbohydrate-binding protein, partial [Prevotellaceae bacterium]|nr:carbohydrate-binding protein [Prevotellaceae bacterium]